MRRGFSLVELLVVIALVMVFATMALYSARDVLEWVGLKIGHLTN